MADASISDSSYISISISVSNDNCLQFFQFFRWQHFHFSQSVKTHAIFHTHTHTQTHTIAFVMWPRPLPLWYISVQPPHRPHFPPAVAVYNKTFIASCHAQACPSSSVRCDCLLLSCHTPHQIPFHQRANTPPPPLHSCSSCGTSKYNAYAALNSQQDRQKVEGELMYKCRTEVVDNWLINYHLTLLG